MADEITIGAMLAYEKNGVSGCKQRSGLTRDWSGTEHVTLRQSGIGTTAEAIIAADVAKGGYFFGWNPGTKVLEVRAGTAADDLIRLEEDDICLFRVTDDATPCVVSTDTGSSGVLSYVWIDP